jgi:hypothetical protein
VSTGPSGSRAPLHPPTSRNPLTNLSPTAGLVIKPINMKPKQIDAPLSPSALNMPLIGSAAYNSDSAQNGESDAKWGRQSEVRAQSLDRKSGTAYSLQVVHSPLRQGDVELMNAARQVVDEKKGRVYANNQPRIVLEILSARSALIILALTYTMFIIGFSIDAVSLTKAFHNSNQVLTSQSCSSSGITHANYTTSSSWGCFDVASNSWNSTVVGLNNIISVQLNVEQFNFSGLFNYSTDDPAEPKVVYYNIYLYACFQSSGCGGLFLNTDTNNQNSDNWNQVVVLDGQQIKVYQHDLEYENYAPNGLTRTVLDNTFQNQESIPDRGVVQSYFFKVEYYNAEGEPATNLLASTDAYVLDSIQYTVLIVNRPSHAAGEIVVIIILMVFTIMSLAYFIHRTFVQQTKKSLPEQRWVVVYLIIVFIYQNIIYCSIYWMKTQNFSAVYGSYVLDAIGQAGLFTVWLIFSDSVRKKSTNIFVFYVPKIFFGFCIFLVNLVVLTYQFPSITPYNPGSHSSVESFSNWPKSSERAYVAFSTMYILLLWIFVIRWFYLLFLTRQELRSLPYMGTRYLQLSYRFFLLQATLLTLFYIFEYGYILISLANNATTNNVSVTDLANDLNTLFREQTQLFGKILFLSVYAYVLAFIFLPANIVEQQHHEGLAANLAATYVITVEELRPVVKSRRRTIRSMNKLQKSVFQQLVHYKAEVFCADLALTLCNLSMEAYYDIIEKHTASGFGHSEGIATAKYIEAEKFGYSIVGSTYHEDHDTFCVILRHLQSKHLVVMFRGTASRKHWKANLNYAKLAVEVAELHMVELDKVDGMDTPDGMGHTHLTLMQRLASLTSFNNEEIGLCMFFLPMLLIYKFSYVGHEEEDQISEDSDTEEADEHYQEKHKRDTLRRDVSTKVSDAGTVTHRSGILTAVTNGGSSVSHGCRRYWFRS